MMTLISLRSPSSWIMRQEATASHSGTHDPSAACIGHRTCSEDGVAHQLHRAAHAHFSHISSTQEHSTRLESEKCCPLYTNAYAPEGTAIDPQRDAVRVAGA
jgi:hypothetical protein